MNSRPPSQAQAQFGAMLAVQERTRALWPGIAAGAGLSAGGARFRRLQVNSRREDLRCVLQITTGAGAEYVLRADFGSGASVRFARHLERHGAAARALRDVPGVSVPQILWQDPARGLVLMEFAPGDTGAREVAMTGYGLGRRETVFQRAGQAVAALHRVSAVGERQFWPKPFLARVADQAREVRDGAMAVPRPKRFVGLCAYLHRQGRRARGHRYLAAVEHGDLHLRNMLISPDQVSFIDFSNDGGSFPQRDLASLWLANCPDLLAQAGQAAGFGGVADADWQAFARGYGSDPAEDPVFGFFYGLRLLRIWRQLAARPQPLDHRSQRQLQAVLSVFETLRAAEPD